MLPIIKPDLTFDEVEADIRAILDSGRLTSGRFVADFEAGVAAAVGVAHAVAVTSATTALHLSLAALGVGPGDEVLVSDFTFPATGNVVVQLGAVPVLVDSRADAFALDVAHAASLVTDRTRAIIPVDPFGQPADLFGLGRLAGDHGLALVEDAACALGSWLDGRACGAFPNVGCLSFHPRKVVTTGEGGAITTDDGELADRLRRLRSHGAVPGEVGMQFVDCGYNYRLSELQAALGLAQLRRLDQIISDRQRTARVYIERLQGVEGVRLPRPGPGEIWSFQSLVVMLDDAIDRNAVVRLMAEAGIETTLGTYAMHAHPAFARFGYEPGQLPNSWRAQNQSLTLPLLPSMDPADVDRVVDALGAATGQARSGKPRG